MAHYSEAFSTQPGSCFRFIHSGVGHAAHCPEPVVVHGVFTDAKGRKIGVDACAEHAGELSDQPS